MCLSNIANQAEYLNLVSNMENDDKATPEGMAELDAALAKLAKINLAKIAMFDELVKELDFCGAFIGGWAMSITKQNEIFELVARAMRLKNGELP